MKRLLESAAPPVVSTTALLLLWGAATALSGIDPSILPGPWDVLDALKLGLIDGRLYPHLLFTLQATALGLLIGCAAGVGLGVLLAEFRIANQFVYPVVIGLQSMPLVAIAPLLIVWLGIGIESKIFMVAQVCFFPTFVNTAAGLSHARPEFLDLYRTFSAGRWHVLKNVKLPSAGHQIFGGLQIAVVLSLIGCVVAEFIASKRGLGYLIKALSGQLDVSMMFAAIIVLALLGSLGGLLVDRLHRKIVFWDGPGGR